MAVKAECDHTDQHILCPTCDSGDPLWNEVKPVRPKVQRTARYHGDCPECGYDVYGRPISPHPDTRLWVCVSCLPR